MATKIRSIFDMSADICRFRGQGVAFTATAGIETSHDYKLTQARLIDGTQLILKDHAFGDSIDFKVVDVDNILGYGAGSVLDNFGLNWYVCADKQDQGHIRMPYSAELAANLYIRLVYRSVGASNVSICLNLFIHDYTS